MRGNKLILLLESLDGQEWKQLEAFLTSPYFNTDPEVLLLFRYLAALHPGIIDSISDKKDLYHAVFPGKPYEEKQFRYLLSDLNQLAEQFLAIQRLREQSLELDIGLMDELSGRGLEKAYQQVARRLQKKLEDIQVPDRDILLSRFKVEEVRQKHFERSHIRRQDFTVQHMGHYLDQFYFLYRLYLSCAMLDHQTIFEQAYQINLSDQWVEHLASKDCFDHSTIRAYYTVYQALKEKEEAAHFQQLKVYLSVMKEELHPEDLKDIYLFAINYCARKIRSGEQEYIAEALELNVKGIETEVLLEKGQLSPWTFSNVVKLALRLEKYQWIADFMDHYGEKLMPEFRKNALLYNRAELYYATQRYGAAQQELLQVAFSDLNYYLGARVLLAKIYYETEEEEALLSLLASFTIFLKRKKNISKDIKEACLNFCTILFQLVRKSPRQITQLKEKMEGMTLLTERGWLEKQWLSLLGD